VSGRDSAWNFAMPPVAGSPSAAIQPERETVTAIALAPPSATLVLVGDATPEEPESAKVVEPESAKLAEPESAKPVEPESAKPSEPESPAVRRPVRRVDAVDGLRHVKNSLGTEPFGSELYQRQAIFVCVTGFSELGLAPEILEAIRDVGYEKPSPIQEQAIPALLEGRDVIGQAQTGTELPSRCPGIPLPSGCSNARLIHG